MTQLRDYPYWPAESLPDVREQMRQIANIRKDDITQFANLPSVFISGRKVGRVPTGSADVLATDKVGDFNVTDAYAYFLVLSGGNAVWRRVAVSSW